MIPHRLSPLTLNSAPPRQRWLGAVLGLSLLASVGGALSSCSAQSNDSVGSTDTGNPPVIAEQRLRVTVSDDGVVVSGEPGAVSGGAQIEVTNLSTNESRETTAASDGSFDVALPGTPNDEYRVEAELNGKKRSASVSASGAAPSLDGHTFLLDSIEGHTLVESTTIRLSFQEDQLNFNAGCNGHFGTYSLCDGKLCVTDFGSTEIGCGEGLHEQDAWLADFLSATPTLSYEPPQLTIADGEVTLEFLDREVADPDRPLTDRVWSIDTFFSGGSASNVPLPSVPTVRFEADGSFSVFDTCNTLDGFYTIDGQELDLRDVSTTDIACTDTGSEYAQNHIGQVFGVGTLSYSINAARLNLMRDELGVGATTD